MLQINRLKNLEFSALTPEGKLSAYYAWRKDTGKPCTINVEELQSAVLSIVDADVSAINAYLDGAAAVANAELTEQILNEISAQSVRMSESLTSGVKLSSGAEVIFQVRPDSLKALNAALVGWQSFSALCLSKGWDGPVWRAADNSMWHVTEADAQAILAAGNSAQLSLSLDTFKTKDIVKADLPIPQELAAMFLGK